MQRFESHAHRSHSHCSHHQGRRSVPSARNSLTSVAAIGAILLLATWAGGATLYILFKDDALQYLVERQIEISRSYETQAASLQTEIDRLRSIKLIEQERVDRAVASLARRQTVIESRQAALSALGIAKPNAQPGAPEITGALPADRQAPATTPSRKPSPLSDTILIAPPNTRWAQLESRPLPPLAAAASARASETATEVHLANLGRDLLKLETAQSAELNEIEVGYDSRRQSMRKVLDELGVRPDRSTARLPAGAVAHAGMGGPFLPWTRPADDPFARQLHRIRTAVSEVDLLRQEITTLPVLRPTAGEADVTSSFGMRLDPFLRQPAMHAGVDFRGETGDPVYATARGRVVLAERNGGYGLMVEIDHGNGLMTRYAHLSAISVATGATIAPGDPVGRIGSTGRSTGPHLHYEIRVAGEPSDPQRFLRAGLRLSQRH